MTRYCDATFTISGLWCVRRYSDEVIQCERTTEHDDSDHFNWSHCSTGHLWCAVPRPTATVVLPDPDGMRGSGAPWWRVGTPESSAYGSVSPIEGYNLADPEVPCLSIGVHSGQWPLDEARALAAAILAAIEAAGAEASNV